MFENKLYLQTLILNQIIMVAFIIWGAIFGSGLYFLVVQRIILAVKPNISTPMLILSYFITFSVVGGVITYNSKRMDEADAKAEDYKNSYQGIKERIDSYIGNYRSCLEEAGEHRNSIKKDKERMNCVQKYSYQNHAWWRDYISNRDVSDSEQEELLDYYDEEFQTRILDYDYD